MMLCTLTISTLFASCVFPSNAGASFRSQPPVGEATADLLRSSGSDDQSLPISLDRRRCERVTIPMCKDMRYNWTKMPNQFLHETQEEAGMEVHQFWPLAEINCSPHIKFFLCSMYAPICFENYDKPVPPCRSVCESARNGCAPLMRQYGFEWPVQMDCNMLPQQGDPDRLCMEPNETTSSAAGAGRSTRPSAIPPLPSFSPDRPSPEDPVPYSSPMPSKPPDRSGGGDLQFIQRCTCECTDKFIHVPETHPSFKRYSAGNVSGCAQRCESSYFDADNLQFSKFWVGLWAVLCCAFTLATMCTFLIDMDRFRYPEQSIIFLSFCYFMVSLGYIIRLIAKHENVACDSTLGVVRVGTTDSALCTIVFLLIYIFGMASAIWWAILTLTWFLAAGLKWSNEAIAKYAQYFHIVAWTVPSVSAVAILALSAVDGDPITGICYVGNTNTTMLYVFVVGPLLVYLLLGSTFLLAGFVSLFRIRSVVKQQGKRNIEKLEHLMVRIGIFSVLYTVPATIVVACYFYEAHYRLIWEMSRICSSCFQKYKPDGPDFAIFMLRHSVFLVIGITSGLWIWSRKALASWRRFAQRVRASCPGGRHHTDVSHAHCKYYPADAIMIRSQADIASCGASTKFDLRYNNNL